MSVNKVILLGNVGRDPKMSFLSKGHTVAQFTMATNERKRATENSPETERTEWHNIVMMGRNAELADRYIRKGTRLYVEGKLRTRSWNDKNGITHYITEIYVDNFELLGSKPQSDTPQGDASQGEE
ncbi:MAG: single-stranded DNA-binding protein [Muribaculaceae bacterium]|nr:single-stranded DNA-binding protein [Muribaculaceae bacterium]